MGKVNFKDPSIIEWISRNCNLQDDDLCIDELERVKYITLGSYAVEKTKLDMEDLKLLMDYVKLKKIDFQKIDFENQHVPVLNSESVDFNNCNMKQVNFEQQKNIRDIALRGCDNIDFNSFITYEKLEKMQIINGSETKLNQKAVEEVLRKYPDYDNLDPQDKFDISTRYNLWLSGPKNIDLLGVKNLKSLKTLDLNNIKITQEILDDIGKMENLETLIIGKCDLRGLTIPKIKNLKNIKCRDIELESIEIFKNIKDIETLDIRLKSKKILQGLQLLKDFKNIKTLSIDSVKNISENLNFKNNKIESLTIINCDIKDVGFIGNYKKTQEIDISDNPVDVESKATLESFREKGVKSIRIKNTQLETYLESKKISIQNKHNKEILKKFLYCNDEITELDIWNNANCFFSKTTLELTEECDLEELNQSGILKKLNIQKLSLKVEENNEKTEEIMSSIKKLDKNIKIDFEIDNFNCISQENINFLMSRQGEANFQLKGELKNFHNYNLKTTKAIKGKIEEIKAGINPEWNELEKLTFVYRVLGEHIEYDYSGVKDSKEYIEGNEVITRNLEGTLLRGKGVCKGYSSALKHVLNCIGSESREVSGNVRGIGHSWNQVKINNKWYNMDLTWDRDAILQGKEPEDFLRSDDEFKKYRVPEVEQQLEVCTEDMDRKLVLDAIKKVSVNKESPKAKYFSNPEKDVVISQQTAIILNPAGREVAIDLNDTERQL